MAGRKRREIPTLLARGRDRFEAWRRKRQVGTRIPERLWKLAVKLAEPHGLRRTASVLRLDYYSLKKRFESTNSVTRSAPPGFVKLASPPLATTRQCVIEFADGAGASMRVHLEGYDAPDLVALGRSFWNGE